MPRWFDPKITLGNVLTVVAMIAALVGGYINLKIEVQGATATAQQAINAIASVKDQVEPVDDLKTRMVVVERNQVTGREQREEFQQRTEAAIEEIRKQNIAILQAIARLEAKTP